MPSPELPDKFAPPEPPSAAASAPQPVSHQGLSIAAQGAAALSPEQRRYNQLVAKVQKARADLQAWEEAARAFAQDHARLMHPQMAELAKQRRLFALKLAALLASGELAKAARRTLARCLCDETALLVSDEFIDETEAAELEALYDRYADAPLAEERRETLADMKRVLEAASGVDLGDAEFDSEEELIRHAQQRAQAAAAGQQGSEFDAEAESAFDHWLSPQQRKRNKKREQKKADQQALATQSVREIFRKLASALHPDRAADEADHSRRTALMQRVNQAYKAQDLLALFTLQLEIEQVDARHLSRAGSERIRHYNRVLSSQLAELQSELQQRQGAFSVEFGFDTFSRLDPRKLGAMLKEDLRAIASLLHDVARDISDLDSPAGIKRFVQRERAEQRMEDEGLFDLPF